MNRLRQLFTNPELRKRLIFTLVMLVIYRLGVHVSVPGVNPEALAKNLGKASDLLNVVDLFSGGAFKKFSVFALGITPYITASIVLQLMGAVVPTLENLQKKEGEAGRQKINQWTRYLTVGLAFVQGFGIATLARNLGTDVVTSSLSPMGFKLLCAFTLTTGSIFIMWIGEQITDRGLGNGISLLIFAGIVAGLPKGVQTLSTMFVGSLRHTNPLPPGVYLLLLAAMIVVLLAVVLVENAYRRIPIHYARRVDSSRMASQRSSYLPLKLNTSGVMPVIFASSVIFFPATIAQYFKWEWLTKGASYISPQTHFWVYLPVFVATVIFFAFFYTSIVFNPDETAENMKKSGGYIPGIRPGRETSIFMDSILSKLTFAGAVYLAVISIVPLVILNNMPGLNFNYGGTSLLIVVGVALDTVAQVESYQIMRHYDGFLEQGRVRGGRLARAAAAGARQ
jgi:preprotein translocase subunit SecY